MGTTADHNNKTSSLKTALTHRNYSTYFTHENSMDYLHIEYICIMHNVILQEYSKLGTSNEQRVKDI